MRKFHAIAAMICLLVVAFTASIHAEQDGKVQILLLGDSTTIGSICRLVEPKGPHLEDVIQRLLAVEKDLPATNVINQGRDGEYIHGLLTEGRYDKEIAPLKGIDYVFIRYGLNDMARRKEFAENFPKDLSALIARLRTDFPQAVMIPTTIIPYVNADIDEQINVRIRQAAEMEKLPVFDVYTRYAAELKKGEHMLNYRRHPLKTFPDEHKTWVQQFILGEHVVVLDNRLDAHFGALPNWYADRHPNLAGYHVIGDETAKYLIPLLRERTKNK